MPHIGMLSLAGLGLMLTACGGGGAATTCTNTGSAPSGVTSADSAYCDRWSWRGTGTNVGADGPRATGVHAWGTARPIANFQTTESYQVGIYTGSSGTTADTWTSIFNDGDPIGDIGARYAYSLGLTGAGVKVAIVDGHINGTHADLSANYLKFYDASSAGVGPSTYGNHGTHVAGIVAASSNGIGTHGVAYDASLIGISFRELSGGALDVSVSKLATATTSAVSDGARIFNNSWGTTTRAGNSGGALDNTTYRAAVADAIAQGSVFVWAAGNSYSSHTNLGNDNTSQEAKAALAYPELAGGFVNVINLDWNPTTNSWVIANSTGGGDNWGSQICGVTKSYCLGAPGSYISSTYAPGGYISISGTSMAAPMVSGGLAILFQAFPYVKTSDILTLMFNTATDLGDPGVDDIYGHGMMNLEAALRPSGSANIPTTASTATNVGIAPSRTSMTAEPNLHAAVSSAARDMIMLDSFDRAFVVGAAGLNEVRTASTSSATALTQDLEADFKALSGFGSPITAVAAQADALGGVSDRIALKQSARASEVHWNAVAKDGSGSAEVRYVVNYEGQGWQSSRSLGLIQEQGQLFGNRGSGAYDLADQATTLSLGTTGVRHLRPGVALYAGIGLSQTRVQPAASSLISVSNDLTSASGRMGFRFSDLGLENQGVLSVQVSQDRNVIAGDAQMQVPIGRESGGVIVFADRSLGREALSTLPKLEVSYSSQFNADAHFALSAATDQDETVVSAEINRVF